MSKRRRSRNKAKSLYIWHRYAGLFAAFFVIFLSITGIALNHTDDLSLKSQHITSNTLLDLYRVQAPTHIWQVKTAQHTVTQADDVLFVNSGQAISIESSVVGAAMFDDFLIIALTNALLLVDANNQVVETLTELDNVPKDIEKLGVNGNGDIYLQSKQQLLRLNNDLSLQSHAEDVGISWVELKAISGQEESSIIQRYKSNIISLETLMLDIHSGRFFGPYGVWFFDFIGIILLFLASTGIIIWLKQRP
jgi:hypothetical protein